jgi:hypothetical protein
LRQCGVPAIGIPMATVLAIGYILCRPLNVFLQRYGWLPYSSGSDCCFVAAISLIAERVVLLQR